MAHPVPDSLIRSIVATYAPRRIVLFGSAARGEAGPDSDLDLLVVLDDDAPLEALSHRLRRQARLGYAGAVDIVPCREEAFRRQRDVVGSLAYAVLTEGVTVYERC